jgi:hypothetical protein
MKPQPFSINYEKLRLAADGLYFIRYDPDDHAIRGLSLIEARHRRGLGAETTVQD